MTLNYPGGAQKDGGRASVLCESEGYAAEGISKTIIL